MICRLGAVVAALLAGAPAGAATAAYDDG